MSGNKDTVAIIGAGPAGLCAALSLHAQGIPCEIYEARPEPSKGLRNFNGSLFIMDNGATVLDKLGAYGNLHSRGLVLPVSALRNADNSVRDYSKDPAESKAAFGRLRIARRDLHIGLLEEVQSRGITLHVDNAFSHIISDSGDGSSAVLFQLQNGETRKARMIIGADGINSKVRPWVAPGAEPQYTGTVLLGALVNKSKLRYPAESGGEEYFLPSFVYGEPGVYAMIPQAPDEDGDDMLLFTQVYTSKDSDAWHKYRNDKSNVLDAMRKHRDYWVDPVRSAIDSIDETKLLTWAIHTLWDLPQWASNSKNIILIGDAAHAVDPASAQGVNQAFEDGYALAMLLKVGLDRPQLMEKALGHWLDVRRKRLGLVAELARINQNMRKPESEREPNDEDRMREVRQTLILYDCDKDIRTWVNEQVVQNSEA